MTTWSSDGAQIADMIGKTFEKVSGAIGDEQLEFIGADNGPSFVFYHSSDCCESVDINEIIGNLDDLVGVPLLMAEEVSNADDPGKPSEWAESWTWTFYRFGTIKGYVTVRWLGTSNGYYGESVAFGRTR